MSRVAKKPVAIAKGVEINVQGGTVNVKGPKGTLSIAKPEGVDVVIENGQAQMSTADASLVPMAGTLRAILANMVQGVSEGFVRKLELVGVGYRASMQGHDLSLALGPAPVPWQGRDPEGARWSGRRHHFHLQGHHDRRAGAPAGRRRRSPVLRGVRE